MDLGISVWIQDYREGEKNRPEDLTLGLTWWNIYLQVPSNGFPVPFGIFFRWYLTSDFLGHFEGNLFHLSFQLHALSDDSVCDFQDPTLAPLRDAERFGIAQRLFASADIALERMQFSAKATVPKGACIFPLILLITLSGLCTLSKEHEEHLGQSEGHATGQD